MAKREAYSPLMFRPIYGHRISFVYYSCFKRILRLYILTSSSAIAERQRCRVG